MLVLTLSLEIAQFLEDEALINENRTRTQPLLRRHARDPIVPTPPFFDRFSDELGVVSGAVPLTPIQRWFFEQALPAPQHFNQAVLLELGAELEPDWVQRVVQQLLVQHDALRLRFISEGTGWWQINAGLEDSVPFAVIDLSGIAEEQQRLALEAVAAAQQVSLNLSSGPLVRVVLFQLGS